MKLLIMVPIWKRPEILKLFVNRLNFPYYCETRLLFIISPEDPYYKANLKLIQGYDYFVHENDTLGQKKNAGLQYALHWQWDYFTEFGSDNIWRPELWKVLQPYFATSDYFGINSCHFWDLKTDKTIHIKNYNEGNAIGAARCIKRNVIEDVGKLWRDDWTCGMDGCSHFAIEKKGYKQTVIDTGEQPLILDIKTATNVNPFFEIEDDGVPVDSEWIKEQFDISNKSIDPVYFTTIEIEEFWRRVEIKTQVCGKQAAFNQVNTEYAQAFGRPRFKNYEVYRNTISQKFKR